MASRSLFKDVRLLKINSLSISFKRSIKILSRQKRGKLSIVKKKFVQEEKAFEILEVKDSSSIMKRLNWENSQLFGEIVSAAQHCYYKSRSAVVSATQKSVKKPHIFQKMLPPIVDEDCAIPVKEVVNDVDLLTMPAPLQEFDTISVSNCTSTNVANSGILSRIEEFPLINVLPKQPGNDLYVKNLNFLRQHLLSLCKSNDFPSVTSVLEKTMPPERAAGLAKWKSNMIQQMGHEKFSQYQQEVLCSGSAFHNCISMYLCGTPESKLMIEEANAGYWTSMKSFLQQVKDTRFLEEQLAHQFLCYRGVADCFARYKDNFAVFEWKTSSKLKCSLSSTFDSPLQVAAYAGALNFDKNWGYMVNTAVLAVAYKNGQPASVHYMDERTLLRYWNEWLKRLKCYWENLEARTQSDEADPDI